MKGSTVAKRISEKHNIDKIPSQATILPGKPTPFDNAQFFKPETNLLIIQTKNFSKNLPPVSNANQLIQRMKNASRKFIGKQIHTFKTLNHGASQAQLVLESDEILTA